MENWKFGPPILVGERVVWLKNDEKASEGGAVRWIGKLSRESKDWTVGIELDNPMPSGGTDGTWGERKLFHCDSRKGVFLPLSRIRKEGSNDKLNNTHENSEERSKKKENSKGRENRFEGTENDIMAERTIKELPKWINNVNKEKENVGNVSSDSHELKLDVQSIRKPLRRHKKRSKSPKVVVKRDDYYYSGSKRNETRRPFSVTGKISETSGQSNDKWQKKYESCALEEKYIREFIQREINKHRNGLKDPGIQSKMNDVKGNFKRIDEDEIHGYGSERLNGFQDKPQKKYDGRLNRRSDALNPREKSNGFFSFLKWFRKSKEMPELESGKDSSAASSPLFVRRRSSSCGSVDTLFSIATANSFAFVSPVQYQAVISSSHTTYPVPSENQKAEEAKSRNYSDYENDPGKSSEEVKTEGGCSAESRKKCKAPDPPRDISLPSTLEHKKTKEEDEPEGKGGHRRTVSESFKDKKAGYYCHVQGKRKAPLPPSSAPLYPSLTSLKSQCPSISKKKRPAPPPPDVKENVKANSENVKPNNQAQNSNYDNIPYIPGKNEFLAHEESFRANGSNLSPLLALKNDISSSPLPSRPWYKRNSSGSNILKKESVKLSDRKKNKENDEWMPEVGFSRRPFTNENAHNIFNFLSRLDRSQEKKEEKRKSQVSILANISELDREAAEIVRKGQAQEKKMMADNDEKYYANKNVLASFPAMPNGAELSKPSEKEEGPQKTTKSPFDEFKPKVLAKKTQDIVEPLRNNQKTKEEEDKEEYDASAELDYYINPWNCPKCTLENPGWQKFCEACNMMRVKFRSVKQTENKEPEKSPVGKVSDVEQQEEQKGASPVRARTPEEEKPPGTEADDPSEGNLEGVRRKRLAFFLSKQSSSRDSTVTEDEDEKTKLKMMLKEMKDSLPKRGKGVINNAALKGTLIEAAAGTNAEPEGGILGSREETLGDAESKPKEFSNTKVQQTWQPIANESNKYGAIKKRREVTPSDTAEAIIVTKTTILEDIIVKKGDKGQKVSSSAQTSSSANDGYQVLDKGPVEHTYTNVEGVRGRAEVVDLSAPENTFTNGDIEAITAKLQREGAGLADYKVDIQSTAETNTMNVNRLLKKLEAAINTGQHLEAANIAKELARMKVSCSVNRQNVAHDPSASKIIVDLYVEDKMSHKGPIQIKILSSLTLAQLKTKVEREWNIPRNVQRWILGKQLATDEDKTLEQHGVVSNSSPLFLYIVTPEQGGEQSGSCLKNIPEPGKIDRRNGKILYAEARRPSLIIEEEGESSSEDSGKNPENESREMAKSKPPESPKLSTPGARRREAFRKRDSQSSSSFEKREVNEQLKKELKVITVNSVKDRIEKLYRAASGRPGEAPEPSGWKSKDNSPNKQKGHYNELMQLENADLVPNTEEFECPICLIGYEPGEGVVLKDCLHTFCRPCLVNTIQFNEEAEVKCPYRDDNYSCESVLQQREIKSLVSKGLFEQHLAKSVSVAENKIGNAYHCKTPDCKGWCILEDNVNEFHCPVCKVTNCLTCQSIHTGMNCRQYQEQIEFASDTNAEAKKTRDMLQEMVEKGEAMACPTCQVVLMKKWGCDWLRCSMCKTEICWVTRGPRWGPGGKGDTSGGCQCGVNGVKCHPKCNYCH